MTYAGEELILALGKLPRRILSSNGQKVEHIVFTHGRMTAEQMAFHARDVLSEANWERLRRNEPVEQITECSLGRYRVEAYLYPEMVMRFRPISFLP